MPTVKKELRVSEAILLRRSVRGFRPDPVPREVIEEILELARHSPSWANTQPWEVAVVTGEPLAALKEGFSAKVMAGIDLSPEVTRPEFPETYAKRRQEIGRKIFEALGVGRDDAERRLARQLAMQRFLGAPVGLIFYMDSQLGPWSMLDLGLYMQTIMLAAVDFGVGSCSMAAVANYPDVIRAVLKIPEGKRIYLGMALGYADEDAPGNRIRSPRLPLDEFVTWHGTAG